MDAVTLAAANAAAKKNFQPLSKRSLISNLLAGKVYQAHRGFGQVAPENTIEAARMAFASGAHELNVDTWPLKDGPLLCMHDPTLDRTTTASGNVVDIDSAAALQLVVDAGAWFGGGWGNLKAPLFSQVAGEFAGRMPLSLQAKPTAGSGAALVKACQDYGITPLTARIASFALAELSAAITAGYKVGYVLTAGNYAAQDPAALAAQGISLVCLDMTASGLQSQAQKNAEVARWHAAGIRVQAYSPLRRVDVWPWLLAGADEFASDEPMYQRPDWVPYTSDAFKGGNYPHGTIAAGGFGSSRGSFVGPIGAARWTDVVSGTRYTFQGAYSPIAGAIETTMQAAASAGATSLVLGPQNKPLSGTVLTLDPPPGTLGVTAVGTGGTFTAATYYWTTTAVTASGESAQSIEKSAAIVASGSATVQGTAPGAATSINVYRGTAAGGAKTLIGQATISGKTFSFTDTGAAGTTAPPTGVTETATTSADGTYNADGTWTVTVPALARAHAVGSRVYGGLWTVQLHTTYDALGTDTSRHADLLVGCPDDTVFSGTSQPADLAFQAYMRATGAMATAGIVGATALTGNAFGLNTTAVSAPLALSAGLASGVAVTSLPVTATASALAAGAQLMLPTGQVATVATGGAASGATGIPVNSITPSAAVASGAAIPQTVPLKVQRTATSLIFTRTDTAQSITVNTTGWFGGYMHFGKVETTGLQVSWTVDSITTP